MRAVTIPKTGGPEVLEVGDVSVRDAGPGEVRIAVAAAAVNPTDIGYRTYGSDSLPPPWVPGMDAAGAVESVGAGVDRLGVGDRVMAAVTPRRPAGGAQAELLVVPAASVVPIPDGATLAQASTLPMNGLTAMLGLDLMALEPGETLAVSGGAGLLASYAIALAKRRGLAVIADAQPDDAALVRSFGADEVVRRDGGLNSGIEADGLFDTALLGPAAFPAVRDGGGMAVVRGWRHGPAERDIRIHKVRVTTVMHRTDWLERLRTLASEGYLLLRVAAEFPPEQAAEAHRVMDAGGLRGRAVIVF
jgi:NADPH:quinone reductase